MPPKLGAKALAKKAANAKAAAKAKAQFEAERKALEQADERAASKPKNNDNASALVFPDWQPPQHSKIYCIPRDAPRVLQIHVYENRKDAEIKYVGQDFGKLEGKFVSAVPALSNDKYYCIPYSGQRVLQVNPNTSGLKSIGHKLSTVSGKYTDVVASEDYRLKLYAAPCRARRVLQVDPATGKAQEVGQDLGDPWDIEELFVRGMTKDSRKANGVYVKERDKFQTYPCFKRQGPMPKDDFDEMNAGEGEQDSDEEFGDKKMDFYIYCEKQRRWCLGPKLGEKWQKAWCWKKGKEPCPPDGHWMHNEVPFEELPDEEKEKIERKAQKAVAIAEKAERKASRMSTPVAQPPPTLPVVEIVEPQKPKKKVDLNQAGAHRNVKISQPEPEPSSPLPAVSESAEDAPIDTDGVLIESIVIQEEEESDEEQYSDDDVGGPAKEALTRCFGRPNIEVKHPPKWWACAYLPNRNRIFGIPYNARRVLKIDPTKDGEAEEVGPDLGKLPAKYMSVALAPNGCLFAAPLNAPRVLMIDIEGKVSLVGPDFGHQERKYACLVAGANKLLYAPPLYADRVLEINCARGDTRQIGPVLGMGEAQYCSAALGKNGYLYCPPLEARRVLEIRPEDHEVEEFGQDLGGAEHEKYCAIAASSVGYKLYAAPREAHRVIEIDPERHFVKEVGPELGRIPRKFSCVLASKGVRGKPPAEEEDHFAIPSKTPPNSAPNDEKKPSEGTSPAQENPPPTTEATPDPKATAAANQTAKTSTPATPEDAQTAATSVKEPAPNGQLAPQKLDQPKQENPWSRKPQKY